MKTKTIISIYDSGLMYNNGILMYSKEVKWYNKIFECIRMYSKSILMVFKTYLWYSKVYEWYF
jgi:hypothetical protein